MCGDAGCTINPLIVIFPSPTAICCPYDPRLHVFPTRHSSVHHPTLCVLPPFIYHIHNYPPHIALPLDVITSPLNQSTLLHLLSKFLAFLAFIAFKGLKRPKKAEKKTFAKWLRIVQFGEKSNKKNFPSQIFFDLCDLGASWSLTLVAFFWEKSGFWGSRRLVLKKVLVSIFCFLASCSLMYTMH